jgi:hypothetical protein
MASKGKNLGVDSSVHSASVAVPIRMVGSLKPTTKVNKMANVKNAPIAPSEKAAIVPDVEMILAFRVKLRDCTVTKDDKGRLWWRLPYKASGEFYQEGIENPKVTAAYLNGGRINIPAEDREREDRTANKETAVPASALARLGVKV